MKKEKGLLMGIAALALLFSMTFLGCESATGAAGDPGDSRELQQHLKIYSNFETVVMGSGTNDFYAVYEGVDLITNPGVIWEVFGSGNGDLDGDVTVNGVTTSYENGHRKNVGGVGTYMDTTNPGRLVVDGSEEALSLTVYATYGGYTESKTVTVGVPKMTGFELTKGSEIGTTNIYAANYSVIQDTLDTTAGLDAYLVYTIDDKERTSLRRDEEITGVGFAKVKSTLGAALEFDIPIPQEKWLTIYQVPRSGGVATTDHVKVKAFVSLPASTATTWNVKLPIDEGVTANIYQTGLGLLTVDGTTTNLTGLNTSSAHGGLPLTFTVYAVYYDPSVEGYGDVTNKRPGLNTRFIPPSGSVNINAPTVTALPGFNRTGTWQVIVQYTGSTAGTGNGAWNYVGAGFPIADAASFPSNSINRGTSSYANTVHISLDDKTFKDEFYLQNTTGLFTGVNTVHISRDSDTGVTLYLNNSDRTAQTAPTLTIRSDAFTTGTTPRVTTDTSFFRISSSDQKYVYATIGGIAPPFTFAFGTASPVITLNYTTAPGFMHGDPQTTLDAGVTYLPGADLIITWYYVNGSTWVDTGITGPSFTPVDTDARGKTLGIRVTVNPLNNPYVTLVDQNTVMIDGKPVTKWTTIDYGQRILGAIANN